MPVAKNPVGCQPIHDKIALADHLNEWSKDPSNWDLCKWVDEVDIDPRLPNKWSREDEYFGVAWSKAKNRIAGRRTEMTTIEELPSTIYNKYQHNYDVMHHEFEEEIKDKDALRKKDIESNRPPATINLIDYSKEK
jgi:hypothetical protein